MSQSDTNELHQFIANHPQALKSPDLQEFEQTSSDIRSEIQSLDQKLKSRSFKIYRFWLHVSLIYTIVYLLCIGFIGPLNLRYVPSTALTTIYTYFLIQAFRNKKASDATKGLIMRIICIVSLLFVAPPTPEEHKFRDSTFTDAQRAFGKQPVENTLFYFKFIGQILYILLLSIEFYGIIKLRKILVQREKEMKIFSERAKEMNQDPNVPQLLDNRPRNIIQCDIDSLDQNLNSWFFKIFKFDLYISFVAFIIELIKASIFFTGLGLSFMEQIDLSAIVFLVVNPLSAYWGIRALKMKKVSDTTKSLVMMIISALFTESNLFIPTPEAKEAYYQEIKKTGYKTRTFNSGAGEMEFIIWTVFIQEILRIIRTFFEFVAILYLRKKLIQREKETKLLAQKEQQRKAE